MNVQDLSLWVRLGCTESERAHLQEVRVSIHIAFSEVPDACFSDELRGTVCYAELCSRLKNYCESREFKTVEKMAMGCSETVQTAVGSAHRFSVEIHKVRPPVPGLGGGVVFGVCNDT
jgi:7,8-dihydroneopterin aldolase/epimerase/oxygenase